MQSTIRAFQKIIESQLPLMVEESKDTSHLSFWEQFAIKRFVKKLEVPDHTKSKSRKELTFQNWVEYDQSLPLLHLPHGSWYRARLKIHKILRDFHPSELTFTGGSSSEPLHGMQSIADKLLTHKWECSSNCADLFVNLAVNDHAFIRAAKYRMRKSLGDKLYLQEVRRIFSIRRRKDDVKKWLLYSCLVCREASRYSTVRKNNDIDRSIDLQQFINMLVQRAIGVGLRDVIRKEFHIDLEETQPVHGRMIKDLRYATIDLKNASDSNTWDLVRFLTPRKFSDLLSQACPPFVEGLDGHFYVTKKVSSMGNGFTFELMTLFLLVLVREFDSTGSVFGDDIVIRRDVSSQFITALESAGWVVNKGKSFIDGPFRESCGFNYHSSFGYIRSFDFEYPKTIGDCVSFWNKLVLLGDLPFFHHLRKLLYRTLPKPLRGPIPSGITVGPTHQQDCSFDLYFFDEKFRHNFAEFLTIPARDYNISEWSYHEGVVFRPRIRARRRYTISSNRNKLLYLSYLSSYAVGDIPFTGMGDWVTVGIMSYNGYPTRISTLKKLFSNLKG